MSRFIGWDVGGTSTRAALCAPTPGGALGVVAAASVQNSQFPSFQPLARELIGRLGVSPDTSVPVGVAAAGVARDAHIIVHPDYPGGELDTRCFGLTGPVVAVMNDFVAQAWSLCTNAVTQARLVCGPKEHRSAPGVRVILGPGTGLGVAGLEINEQLSQRVIRSEGGHGAIPLQFPEQIALLQWMLSKPDAIRHSGNWCLEAILSGMGLSLIHEFHTGDFVVPKDVQSVATAADYQLFALFLGLACRDKVVTFAGFNGLYLTGGVLRRTKMLELPECLAAFRRGLVSSVRHHDALTELPVWHIDDDNGGALGAAHAASLAS